MKKIIVSLLIGASLLLAQGTQQGTLPMNTPPPTGVQQVYVSQTGTTGQTSYCYYVVAVYNTGMSNPGVSACIFTSNATLTGGNLNTITWNPPPGANPTGYWVIRTTTGTFPGTGTFAVNSTVISSSTFSQTDTSNTLSSFTFTPAPYASGQFLIDNISYSVPVVKLIDPNGNVDAQWYQIAITPPATSSSGMLYSVEGNATVAQLNSIVTLTTPVLGRQYKFVGLLMRANGGTPATCTAITISDNLGGAVASVPVATLTSGTVIGDGGANITFTNFMGPIQINRGLVLTQAGSQCTTMTSLDYRVMYRFL